jgi:GNAT superfamily N-acetyltransferase
VDVIDVRRYSETLRDHNGRAVTTAIRRYAPQDQESVVELALRAWAPVFGSLERELGHDIFVRLHGGDWRRYQAEAVRDTLDADGMHAWVAETAGHVAGFAAATLDEQRVIGEIVMLAVDPDDQGAGIGGALAASVTAWLRDNGMRVAMVETGADPGHAAARRVYERADYRMLGVARYFKPL